MPLMPVIDSSKLREAAARIKQIDPELRKQLIANIKSDLIPYANNIAGDIKDLGSPGKVRGFGSHAGRTSWSPVKASVYVAPGGGKGSVARIEIYGSPNRAAFKIADLAGTRGRYSYGDLSKGGHVYTINGQGEDMVSALTSVATLSAKGKGGRFAWAGFIKYRPFFISLVMRRLDDYSQKIADKVVG